jgi:hypothetical protein
MSSPGAAPRAAVPKSNARAEASRKNGAKSRGPKTPEGKARSAMNALKHGLRAEKYVTLLDEERDEFTKLEAALERELAPEGPLQSILARRIARAAWRLMRADRLETEVFAERHFPGGGPGLALIRDGNGTRTIETLLRYRGAAMAEFQRCLRTLKALQAEQALDTGSALEQHPKGPRGRPTLAHRPKPNQPERAAAPRLETALAEPATPGPTLHEPAALWTPPGPAARATPNKRDLAPAISPASAPSRRTPNRPKPHDTQGSDHGSTVQPQEPERHRVPGRRQAETARSPRPPQERAPRIPRVAWTD